MQSKNFNFPGLVFYHDLCTGFPRSETGFECGICTSAWDIPPIFKNSNENLTQLGTVNINNGLQAFSNLCAGNDDPFLFLVPAPPSITDQDKTDACQNIDDIGDIATEHCVAGRTSKADSDGEIGKTAIFSQSSPEDTNVDVDNNNATAGNVPGLSATDSCEEEFDDGDDMARFSDSSTGSAKLQYSNASQLCISNDGIRLAENGQDAKREEQKISSGADDNEHVGGDETSDEIGDGYGDFDGNKQNFDYKSSNEIDGADEKEVKTEKKCPINGSGTLYSVQNEFK